MNFGVLFSSSGIRSLLETLIIQNLPSDLDAVCECVCACVCVKPIRFINV